MPVPDIDVPVLEPTPYEPQRTLNETNKIKNGVASSIRSFTDSLLSYVPKQVKDPINKNLETLKLNVSGLFNYINKHKFEIR